jgi:hypothetical protein
MSGHHRRRLAGGDDSELSFGVSAALFFSLRPTMSGWMAKVTAAAKTAASVTMEAASTAATAVGGAVDAAMGNLAPRPDLEDFAPRDGSTLAAVWAQQGRVPKVAAATEGGGGGGGGRAAS